VICAEEFIENEYFDSVPKESSQKLSPFQLFWGRGGYSCSANEPATQGLK
jgi:hypothetical protein